MRKLVYVDSCAVKIRTDMEEKQLVLETALENGTTSIYSIAPKLLQLKLRRDSIKSPVLLTNHIFFSKTISADISLRCVGFVLFGHW